MKDALNLLVMFEEEKAENNFTAYVPALQLGTQGDTLEEARTTAIELIIMELEGRKHRILTDKTTIETLKGNQGQDFLVMFEVAEPGDDYTAYIPALRLGVKGNTLADARSNATKLMQIESNSCVHDAVTFETLKIQVEIAQTPVKSSVVG